MSAPFRFVAGLTRWDGRRGGASWTPGGGELGPSDPTLLPSQVPGVLLLEALVQCAGLALERLGGSGTGVWVVGRIADAVVAELRWGEEVALECTVRRRSERAAEVAASATVGEVPAGRADILLVRAGPPSAASDT